jgi:hypothetical protein
MKASRREMLPYRSAMLPVDSKPPATRYTRSRESFSAQPRERESFPIKTRESFSTQPRERESRNQEREFSPTHPKERESFSQDTREKGERESISNQTRERRERESFSSQPRERESSSQLRDWESSSSGVYSSDTLTSR